MRGWGKLVLGLGLAFSALFTNASICVPTRGPLPPAPSPVHVRACCSGGGVSSHLIDHAPCPCLAVPYKFMGLEDGRDTAEEEGATSPTSPMMASPTAAG